MLVTFGLALSLATIEIAGATLDIEPYEIWDLNPRKLNVRFRTREFDTTVVTNRQGLREPRDIGARDRASVRIVAVGDSMTFGWGVDHEQAYPHVTGNVLRRGHGLAGVDVVNMGTPGTSPDRYLRTIRRYASRLQPDVIVIGYLVGNDCPTSLPIKVRDAAEVERVLARYAAKAHPQAPRGQILARSFVFRVLHRRVYLPWRKGELGQNRAAVPGVRDPIFNTPNPLAPPIVESAIAHSPDPAAARARYRRLVATGWVERGLRWQISPYRVEGAILEPTGLADALFVREETTAAMRSEWGLCQGLLLEMKRAAEESGARLVVLVIPSAFQLDREAIEFVQTLGVQTAEAMTRSRVPNDLVIDLCRRHNLACVDPLDRFRAAARDGRRLYFPQDGHMTVDGNRLLGEMLADALAPSIRRWVAERSPK